MNVHFRRAAAAMLTAAAMTALLPSAWTADAADSSSMTIVVIGDSISSGKGLENAADSYVSRVERYYHADVINLAKDDCMSSDLLTALDDPEMQAQLAKADVILFSVGLQDMMNPFQEEVDRYLEEKGLHFKGIDEMFAVDRTQINHITEDELSTEANKLADILRENRETCQENILAIGQKLSAYQNAKIVGLNVYNSLNQIRQYGALSMRRRTAYNSIMNPAKTVLKSYINKAYTQIGEEYGFQIVDTFTWFDTLAFRYTGIEQMEYNPSAEGHEVIAGLVKNAIGRIGDVNGDGAINAKDATMILTAAAKTGTAQPTGLSQEEFVKADVNGDGIVNAYDATSVLRYAAAVSNDSNVTIEDFI